MAWYRCGGGGGGAQITSVQTMTETDYNALQNKDNSTIYNVTNDNMMLALFSAQGSRRIIEKGNISDYEFWYENLVFPTIGAAGSASTDPSIYTDIKLFSSANINRDWQLEFNIEPMSYGGGSENVIIGTTGTSTCKYEVYSDKSSAPAFNLHLYGALGNDSNIGNVAGKDVVLKKEGSTITVFVDGVQTATSNVSSSTTESDEYKMNIGNYREYHTFCGTVHYIGFKWLD